jgi:phosphoesterase RecJ-like protein
VIDTTKYTKELLKLLDSSNNILLICHINPDGDAISSQLALYQYLMTRGKSVDMISPNNIQEFLKWMHNVELINVFIRRRKESINLIEKAEIIIFIDFNQPDRLGEAESYVSASAAKKVIIDHHLNPSDFADLIISDPSKCSTAELMHELITEMNGKPFSDLFYSEDIYVGIITDTGNLDHGAFTARTFRIIADLLESGVERERILDRVYNNFSADRLKLLGFALNKRMTVLPDLKTAYIYLTRNDLAEYNHVKGDTEGFVNMPLSIKGIVLSVMFIEKDNFVKLSFRSKGDFPVNTLASEYFSGGGHMNASGGEYYDSLENTIAYFLQVIGKNSALFDNGN